MNRPLRSTLVHLGSIRGIGQLSAADGGRAFGPVSFEIDSYSERGRTSANGQIEGSAKTLGTAFRAGSAVIKRDGGADLSVVLLDPRGESAAAIKVTAPLPIL